jgi:hypothetical protein
LSEGLKVGHEVALGIDADVVTEFVLYGIYKEALVGFNVVLNEGASGVEVAGILFRYGADKILIINETKN